MKVQLSLLCILAAAACGGSGAISTPEFAANAPTYDKLAISQNDSDEAEPVAMQDSTNTQDEIAATCHPHLFQRSGEIVSDVNRHFFKLVGHVEDLIKDAPKLSAGETRTWENVKNGIDRKLTITATANADGSVTYAFELDLAQAVSSGTASFVKVMDGSVTHSGPATAAVADSTGTTAVENKGTVTFDFSALATVVTTEKSTGQITDTFDVLRDPVKGTKRSASMTLTAFHFDDDLHGPRNGSYQWEREPGVGGKLQFTDSLVLLCPSNPNNLSANMTTVARWYKTTDGSVHGRSDSTATEGQIPAGDTWMGVTCAQGQTTAAPAEGYWMMKLEAADGSTVSAQADTTGAAPCDTAFGAVPDMNDNTNDYNFSAAVTFPGEW